MTAPRILRFRWDGRVMVPVYPGVAAKQYEVGEVYPLEVREDRSINSHRHFFAVVREGWQNLPEAQAQRFPTEDHLRKWLLIRTGFRDERSIPLASKAEAQRVAAFVKPLDDFAVVVAREATVTVLTAKSQSVKAMGRAEFQKSKDAVLDELAAMISVDRKALEQNAGKAA